MATSSSSSASQILCASFNQDNSFFSIGTKDGFKIFEAKTGRLCYEKTLGAFSIVEMLFSSSLLALVGAGEQPSLSPRRLCLFNTATGANLRELSFLTSIVAVRFNRKRLVVLLQDKAFIYDLNKMAILDEFETVPNTKGLCAFAPNSEGCYLAIPASNTRGSVLVYDTLQLQSYCQIDAHRSPLAAIIFSSTGMYLATASEKGTIIRVHLVSQATKSYNFRRGTYSSTIYSLAFAPSLDIPDILIATSSSGSLHIFLVEAVINGSRQNKLLGSVMPDSINDAFDPANHHVVHNIVPAAVKSYVTVNRIENLPNTSPNLAFRASIYVVTQNGYFREYILQFLKLNGSTWGLEREFNVLDRRTTRIYMVWNCGILINYLCLVHK
ncbi:Autophagy-related protein 18 [Rhynchospora pubera]|uniref:Autophagy-related protein 18 n=1 Tax=Rhynchospora pubera TaxID=906938 RepID=A0AAV8HII6_9POAL|nr:Autophagy-related protein 18 [Rhynchospora pubera]